MGIVSIKLFTLIIRKCVALHIEGWVLCQAQVAL